jgi:Leucine-rich repeat (LRR) protein
MKLPANLLAKLNNLEDFNMQKNEVEEIPKEFFMNNSKMRSITISNNNLWVIQGLSTFKDKDVFLGGNKCINEKYLKFNENDEKDLTEKCSDRTKLTVYEAGKATNLKLSSSIFVIVLMSISHLL